MEIDASFIREIITDENALLNSISEPVVEFDEDLETIVKQIAATMFANLGVGLSAIQIGVAKRVIMAIVKPPGEVVYMINPEFVRKLDRETIEFEGCLSIPSTQRRVSRAAKCELKWQDEHGTWHNGNFSGFPARIIQHEMDHLDGILITDKPRI